MSTRKKNQVKSHTEEYNIPVVIVLQHKLEYMRDMEMTTTATPVAYVARQLDIPLINHVNPAFKKIYHIQSSRK